MRFGKYQVIMSACTPSSRCWGTYRRVGVLELQSDDCRPALSISDHPARVRRIVRCWDNCNHGTTDRCASAVAMKQALDLAQRLHQEDLAAAEAYSYQS